MPATRKKHTSTELDATLDKIEEQLAKATEPPDEGMELAKALTDVAKDALAVAKSSTKRGTKTKPRAEEEDEDEPLAKASKDDEDEDDEDEDDDKKKNMPGWLKNIVHDGKSEGEMILAPDRDTTGTHRMTNAGGESRSMSKSLYLDGTEVVDLEPYLQHQLHEQGELRKAVRSLVKLSKGLIQGIVECTKSLEDMQADLEMTQRISATCAKSLSWLMERQLDTPAPVVGSKYATMEKSSAALGERLQAEGGTKLPYNKAQGTKALMKGLLTEGQHRLWKTTGTLPAGVDLTTLAS
jgi:hypothetical protein